MVSQHNRNQKESERKKALEYFEEISQTPDGVLEAAHPTRLRAAAHEALLLPTYSDKRVKCEEAYNKGLQGRDSLKEELKPFADQDLERLLKDIESYRAQEEDEIL